jgi:transposase
MFADAVHRSVDVLDLSAFDAHYCNDAAGAPAHAPGMLLKAVLLAYSQGSSARVGPSAPVARIASC